MTSERNEFEREVRAALRAEAEAGPDYRTVLHTRVMERVRAASTAPTLPSHATERRMVMMAVGAAVVLLVVLAFIVLAHH
jgi:hypothetical protein